MFEWIEIFDNLTEQEKSNLEMFCQIRQLEPQEELFKEWDEATSMYIVKSWLLEAYSTEKWILWTTTSWWLVGEMALFWDQYLKTRTASVKAIENSEVIVIIWFSIKELTNKHPIILEKIKKVIKERENSNLKL